LSKFFKNHRITTTHSVIWMQFIQIKNLFYSFNCVRYTVLYIICGGIDT
jgi:hypothetical protein